MLRNAKVSAALVGILAQWAMRGAVIYQRVWPGIA